MEQQERRAETGHKTARAAPGSGSAGYIEGHEGNV
jgi:hypothetical protein